jgi:hypothetical protein
MHLGSDRIALCDTSNLSSEYRKPKDIGRASNLKSEGNQKKEERERERERKRKSEKEEGRERKRIRGKGKKEERRSDREKEKERESERVKERITCYRRRRVLGERRGG